MGLPKANNTNMNAHRRAPRASSMHPEFARFVEWAGSQVKAAKLLGISTSHTNQILWRTRGVSPEVALRAEQVSDGLVSRSAILWPDEPTR
jgi:DNA-binding transcriptional regulator YdaS (Cro superfamily)